ncbi:transcription factor atoh8 [Antennarius striatus]|uniref:transcription factor atoh8 n=1 Tax=Antennarius striatus TaxID=241820 RepID=UPI0035B234F9
MKNPHSLSHTCKRSIQEPILIGAPGTNKKFKRKSREPRRLKAYPVDTSDVDSVEDLQTEACGVSMLAPLHRQLMMSPDTLTSTTRTLSGLPETNRAPVQTGAIDMRIGINVPAAPTKLSQLPASAFPPPEMGSWPPAIYQPLSSRLKLGLFPPPTAASQPTYSLEPPLPVPRAPQSSQFHMHVDTQVESPKDSPRKRGGASDDGPGRLPEVKAIQQTRRLLANARERTRVHTISAAFEALRKQVPCYSYGQKLSKLAILRIACNYILSLAQLAELDYSSDTSSLSFSQCVEQCTRTLQAEGRSKKRKE